MTEGYYIGMGDKTTCGGEVLDGDNGIKTHALFHACEGDRVTCGKDGKIYRIVGGVSHMHSHGRLMAGTLDSRSGCPCKAELIPSEFRSTYQNPITATRTAEPAKVMLNNSQVFPLKNAYAPSSKPTPVAISGEKGQEPGFYIVPKSMSREALEKTLFPAPDPAVMRKFQALNPRTVNVKAGSLIVLSDPKNFQCAREESILMEAATRTNEALDSLSADEADFMERHREEIQSFLATGSTAIRAGEAMFARNLDDIKTILKDIETLHQNAFLKDGHLRSPEFFNERKRLLTQLDTQLTSFVRKGIGLPDHPNLKSALGISSRSLVHRWAQAGAPDQIPGYTTHIRGVAKAAKVIKYGGWIGLAIGGGASYIKVRDVCSAGDSETCEKVKFTETGSFIGGVGGGAVVGATLSSAAISGLCVSLGPPTAGIATLVCALVVVGATSVAGGLVGEKAGEWVGEKIYEGVK